MQESRNPSRILNVILSCVVVCAIVDAGILCWDSPSSWQARTAILWMTLIWSTIVTSAVVLVFVGLKSIADELVRRWQFPRFTSALLPAAPISFLLLSLFDDLMSGQGFNLLSNAGTLKLAARCGAVVGPVLVLSILFSNHRKIAGRWRPPVVWAEGLTALMMVMMLCLIDYAVYPRLYRAAHVLVWGGILTVVCLWRARLECRRNASEGNRVLAKTALLLFLGSAAFWSNPLEESETRRAAWRDTLFLKRALMHIVPARERRTREVDASVLAALSSFERISSDDLDRILPDRRRTNIVMISIDALRADRVGRRKYHRNLTPNLDALAARSADFTEAWTCCPATLPSFSATMRSAIWLHNDINRDKQGISVAADKRQAVLPVLLQKSGFHTEAVLGVRFPFVVRRLNIGFDRFNVEGRNTSQSAERVTDYGLAAMDQKPAGPFFLWLHYFDPHAPYEGFGSDRFGSGSDDRYDSEVAYVDRELGRFLDGLKARGLDQDTMIILFSDHGEDWDKSGNPVHANDVTEPQIHIPFLIHIPGVSGHRISSPVTNIDLMPTIAEFAGIPRPASCRGRSLLRFVLFGDPEPSSVGGYPEPVAYSESFEGSRKTAVRRGQLKLVHDVEADVFTLLQLSPDSTSRETVIPEDEKAIEDLKNILSAFESGR